MIARRYTGTKNLLLSDGVLQLYVPLVAERRLLHNAVQVVVARGHHVPSYVSGGLARRALLGRLRASKGRKAVRQS